MSYSIHKLNNMKNAFSISVSSERLKSWEHCHKEFYCAIGTSYSSKELSLHLTAYLASFGMYTRKSKLMLQNSYLVHVGLIDILMDTKYIPLFFIYDANDFIKCQSKIIDVYKEIKDYYKTKVIGKFVPSETLVTKIMLGVYGCIPALDTFVSASLRSNGYPFGNFNSYLSTLCSVCSDKNVDTQIMSLKSSGLTYMRILDGMLWNDGEKILQKKNKGKKKK